MKTVNTGKKFEDALANTTVSVKLLSFDLKSPHVVVAAHEARALLSKGRYQCYVSKGKIDTIRPHSAPEKLDLRAGNHSPKNCGSSWSDTGNSICLKTYELERSRREINAQGSHTAAEWQAVIARYGSRCLRCEVSGLDVPLTKDHVIPLAKGGTDFASNLQPLCRRCNSWKGNREIDFRTSAQVA